MNKQHLVSLTEDMQPLEMDAKSFLTGFKNHLAHTLGLTITDVKPIYIYQALSLTLRDRLVERWNETRLKRQSKHRHAYYLSMEYLLGRSLRNAVQNLGLTGEVAAVFNQIGIKQEEIEDMEADAALGNGGLGRLAACFVDSCASLDLPVTGYGIRYQYGMFRQQIIDGYQVEKPDNWLNYEHIWEIKRPALTRCVKFGGHTEIQPATADGGNSRVLWHSTQDVLAVPYDIPIPGYNNGVVNTLRLWKSEATEDIELEQFNAGNYAEAIAEKLAAEKISMVLYPNDATENGKLLRLCQQYFLASASLQDMLSAWVAKNGNGFSDFAENNCFQLNDTHPACSIAELMRLLLDQYHLPWQQAWRITTTCMAYTNHTLLPEALEKWPVTLFAQLLPRLLEIIYEINARFLQQVAQRWPADVARQQRMSIIEEGDEKMIRMAYLSIVGSHSVNGVAALHSSLLKQELFYDFYCFAPQKFNNKTNGVSFRRWLLHTNPELTDLICSAIGDSWIYSNERLIALKPFAQDTAFGQSWRQIKNNNKQRLAQLVERECGVSLNPDSIFDVQVKRIHEYKRQLLNLLHAIHLYRQIKDGKETIPRSIIIAGKAAPGYRQAKLIIKLINNVARVINRDTDCHGILNLVFIPNYRVTSMEIICPGTDLSAQISTAGCEASGTGNMKFMLNGALTIGTLDGANIEIMEAVGADFFFKFGLTVDQIRELTNHYDPGSILQQDEDLSGVMSLLQSGHFNQFEAGLFDPVIGSILEPSEPWKTAADFADFIATQTRAAQQFQDKQWWNTASIENTANSGWFSSDRTINEYNRDIWHLDS